MLTVAAILFFIISQLGWWEALHRKTRINLLFLPEATIALQVTVLFFAGLLNVLGEASVIMYAGGCVFFVYDIAKERRLTLTKERTIRGGSYILLFPSVCLPVFSAENMSRILMTIPIGR